MIFPVSATKRRPVPQSIPITTLPRLIDSRVMVTRCVHQSIISVAHDMLSKGVETVHVMLKRNHVFVYWSRCGGVHGHIMVPKHFLYQNKTWAWDLFFIDTPVRDDICGKRSSYQAVYCVVCFDDIYALPRHIWMLIAGRQSLLRGPRRVENDITMASLDAFPCSGRYFLIFWIEGWVRVYYAGYTFVCENARCPSQWHGNMDKRGAVLVV